MRELSQKHRKGFTLLELILVIGMLAIIALVIIVAINPTEQLADAQGSKRNIEKRELENAIVQYIIDGNSFSGIPSGMSSADDICQDTVTGTDCTITAGGYDLSVLTPDYLVNIPIDPLETGSTLSGYRIYTDGSFIKICSENGDAGCGS